MYVKSKKKTQVPNCTGAEMSHTGAELTWYQNVSHRCRSVLVPNCPGAEVSSIPVDHMPVVDHCQRTLIQVQIPGRFAPGRFAPLNRYYIIIDEVFFDNFLVIIYLLVVCKKNNNIKIE